MNRFDTKGRILRAAALAALAVSVLAAPAFAGKPSGGSTTSSFYVEDGRFATTTTAHRGSSSATWVRARCYQNGTLVYDQYVKYGTSWTATLTLGPTPSWSSGGASCTGNDGWWQNGTRWRVIASDAFTVTG